MSSGVRHSVFKSAETDQRLVCIVALVLSPLLKALPSVPEYLDIQQTCKQELKGSCRGKAGCGSNLLDEG